MNDQGHNNGDFADEPTDPGIDTTSTGRHRHVQQPGQPVQQGQPGLDNPSDAMNSLGFRPQTGAFGAVAGPSNPGQGHQSRPTQQQTFRPESGPQSGQQANTFRGPANAANPGPQPTGNQPHVQQPTTQQGPSSGSFSPPMTNPTGSFNVSTGEFSSPNAGGPQSGSFPANQQSGSFPANQQSGAFQVNNPAASGTPGAPHAQQRPGQPAQQQQNQGYATGQMPGIPGPRQQPQQGYVTGQMQGVPGQPGSHPNASNTGTFQAPGASQPLQIGEVVDKPPEPTIKVRAAFGGGGFIFGAIVGLALGLLNSLFEGVGIVAGLGVTIQIALWFGGMIGLIAAWKPEKVWETLESYGFFD